MFSDQKGFSLIELVTVIAIIGILGAVGFRPGLRAYQESKSRSDQREIISALYKAKMAAIKRNTEIVVNFDSATDSFVVFQNNTGGALTYDAGDILVHSGSLYTASDMYTNLINGEAFTINQIGIPSGLPDSIDLAGEPAGNQFPCIFIKSVTGKYFRIRLNLVGVLVAQESNDGETGWR